MEFKLISTLNELIDIKNEWNSLLENIDEPQVFYKWEWVTEYLKNVDVNLKNSLKVVIVTEKNEIIGIMPFLMENKTLRFITNKTVDYNNIYIHKLHNKYSVLEKVFDYIFKNEEFDIIALENFAACSELYIIAEILRNKFNCSAVMEDSVMVPKLVFSEANTSKYRMKQIKDIDRRKRKLEKEKDVKISVGCGMDEDLWSFIQNHHKKRWTESVFNNVEYVKFYEVIMKKIEENMEVSKLEIDGEIAAAHFGFKDENKVYYYIPIYDEKYSSSGIGYILLKEIIDHYSDKVEFDFLRGNENYKFNWCDNIGMNFNLYIYKPGMLNSGKGIMRQIIVFLKKSKTLRKLFNK